MAFAPLNLERVGEMVTNDSLIVMVYFDLLPVVPTSHT